MNGPGDVEQDHAEALAQHGFTPAHLLQIARGRDRREKLELLRQTGDEPLRRLGFNASSITRILAGSEWREKLDWIARCFPDARDRLGLSPFDVSRLVRGGEWREKADWLLGLDPERLRRLGLAPAQLIGGLSGRRWREKRDWLLGPERAALAAQGLDGEPLARILATGDWRERLGWLQLRPPMEQAGRINLIERPDGDEALSDDGLARILAGRDWRAKLDWLAEHHDAALAPLGIDGATAAQIMAGAEWRAKLDWVVARHARLPRGLAPSALARILAGREWRVKLEWIEQGHERLLAPLGFTLHQTSELLTGRGWREKLAWIESNYRTLRGPAAGLRVNLIEPEEESEAPEFNGSHVAQIMSSRDWQAKLDWILEHHEHSFAPLGFGATHIVQVMKLAGWRARLDRLRLTLRETLGPLGFQPSHLAGLGGGDCQARLRWLATGFVRELQPLGFSAAQTAQLLRGPRWRAVVEWIASSHARELAPLGLRPYHVAALARDAAGPARLDWLARHYTTFRELGMTPRRACRLLQGERWRAATDRLQASTALLQRLAVDDERISPLAERHLAALVFDGRPTELVAHLIVCCTFERTERFVARLGGLAGGEPVASPAEVMERLRLRHGYSREEIELYLAALNKTPRGLVRWCNTGRIHAERELPYDERAAPQAATARPQRSVEQKEALSAVLAEIARTSPDDLPLFRTLIEGCGCDTDQLDAAQHAALQHALAGLRADRALVARIHELLD